MNVIEKEGFEACRNGIKWWNNPYESGSLKAYEWDKGHTIARRSPRPGVDRMMQAPIQLAPGVIIPPRLICRHIGIFGATGKGKTSTAARIVQSLACPVICLDAKGDLGGLGEWLLPWRDLQIDPGDVDILARALDLSAVQAGALEILTAAYPCRTLAGFRDTLAAVDPADLAHLGRVSPVTLGALQRATFGLMRRAPWALGRAWPKLCEMRGRYIVPCDRLAEVPGLYSAFVASMLTRLYASLAEIGDTGAAGLVLLIDESHLVFSDAPPAIVAQIDRVARLIRSKGVGLIWVTQSPSDLPDSIMGQIGTRIQHGLNGATPRQLAQARAAVETIPGDYRPGDVLGLGIGEALVSTGQATARCTISPPLPWRVVFPDAPPSISPTPARRIEAPRPRPWWRMAFG